MDPLSEFSQAVVEATQTEMDWLRLELADLRRENRALRQMIPLLKSRFEAFLVWFQGTVDSIH